MNVLRKWYEEITPETTVEFQPGDGSIGRELRQDHGGFWFGVETWAPNINDYNLWDVYDRVLVSDIRHLDPITVSPAPNLVILNETLIHIAPDEAQAIVRKVQMWTDDLFVVVSVNAPDPSEYNGNWTYLRRFDPPLDFWYSLLNPGLVKTVSDGSRLFFRWSSSQGV